jgi:hypothetical protein
MNEALNVVFHVKLIKNNVLTKQQLRYDKLTDLYVDVCTTR